MQGGLRHLLAQGGVFRVLGRPNARLNPADQEDIGSELTHCPPTLCPPERRLHRLRKASLRGSYPHGTRYRSVKGAHHRQGRRHRPPSPFCPSQSPAVASGPGGHGQLAQSPHPPNGRNTEVGLRHATLTRACLPEAEKTLTHSSRGRTRPDSHREALKYPLAEAHGIGGRGCGGRKRTGRARASPGSCG